MQRQLQAVIFDFDGLIIDSESAAFDAWSAIYREHGCTLSLTEWVECVGSSYAIFDPVGTLARLTRREFDADTRAALMADKEARKVAVCNRLAPLPGVKERLEEAHDLGLGVALASSSSRQWLETHLERIGLHSSFQSISGKDDVARVKPHPDVYLHAARSLSVEPSRCLVFEDSVNGVKAAKAAGMTCIAVPGPITRGLDFGAADAVATSLADVTLAAWLSR
jgi:putative hydrolase of the HAD superfamily